MLSANARKLTDHIAVPLARGLVRVGATANGLTTAGLLLTFAGVVVVLAGDVLAGAWVMAFGAAVDGLDGTVARLRGTTSRFGAFYDSVADRVGESLIFGTAAWLVRDEAVLFALAMVALAAAQLTSYIRARAESVGWTATVGIVERPERMLVLIPSIGFEFLPLGLGILALGSTITVAQRLVAVRRQAVAP